jgi:hypothetical protein
VTTTKKFPRRLKDRRAFSAMPAVQQRHMGIAIRISTVSYSKPRQCAGQDDKFISVTAP